MVVLVVAASWLRGLPDQTDEQIASQRAAILKQVEEGVAPLFVLGDVNEDGTVDGKDAALIEQLAAGREPATATCPASADLNMDGKIDSADLEVMRRMLAQGPITIPALGFQYGLRCSFKRLLLAARPVVARGESNLVYFLDPRFTTENSKVEIYEGHATATAMASHKGYIVASSSSEIQSGWVTLLITLGTDASGGRYYYTYHSGSAAAR